MLLVLQKGCVVSEVSRIVGVGVDGPFVHCFGLVGIVDDGV